MKNIAAERALLMMAFSILSSTPPAVQAQGSIVGKYTGGYVQDTQPPYRNVGLTLNLASADGETVKGTAAVTGGYCPGQYPIEGTYKANLLSVKATKNTSKPGCNFELSGGIQGDTISAKIEGNSVQLKR